MPNNTKNKITPEEFKKMNSEEKILKISGGFVPPKGKPQNEVLELLLNKLEENEPTKKIRLTRYIQAAAAVIIVLVGLKIVPGIISAQQVKTSYAQQSELTLPDGTNVTLNADSKIKWNKKNFNKKRVITLSGEAFLDVKKGDEFIINTKNGTIEILGTQLNIYSRNQEFWVSCLEGKVRISTDSQQKIITPGEWVRLNDSELVKSKSEVIENTILWKDGIIHFEETQLEVIFAELERQFDVKVVFTGDNSRKATIDFAIHNLEEALDIVCSPMELRYEVSNNKKVIISEKQ